MKAERVFEGVPRWATVCCDCCADELTIGDNKPPPWLDNEIYMVYAKAKSGDTSYRVRVTVEVEPITEGGDI